MSGSLSRKRRHGITLIEVIVAIFIFSICIAGFCGMGLMSRQAADRARDHYTAINMARNRLERVKTFEFDQIDYFAAAGTVVDRTGAPNLEGNYRMTTAIQSVTTNLKEIIVQVQIRNPVTRAFAAESETVRTYVANFREAPTP